MFNLYNLVSLSNFLNVSDPYKDWSLKKDLYRREGKGRRCCLGDIIYSVPCHASYFLHQDDLKGQSNEIFDP